MTTQTPQTLQPQGDHLTIDIEKIIPNKDPLPASEQNIFNIVFKNSVPPEALAKVEQQEQIKDQAVVKKSLSPRTSFIKKLLLAIILASIILIHAITPISTLLKNLTTSMVGIVVVITYIVLCYFAVDFVI